MADKTPKNFKLGLKGRVTTETAIEGAAEGLEKATGYLLLDEVLPRANGDSRTPSSEAILDIALSMSDLGQITALTLDGSNRLLCGATRLHAIKLIRSAAHSEKEYYGISTKNIDPEIWKDKFPNELIKVSKFDFDSTQDAALALAIEAAENTKRKGFTKIEVENLVNDLVEKGYEGKAGRRKKGSAPGPVQSLAKLTGRSSRTIQRMLNAVNRKKLGITDEEYQKAIEQKDVKIETLERRARAALLALIEHSDFEEYYTLKRDRNSIEKVSSLLALPDEEPSL